MARAGRAELLIDLVRRWTEFLIDGYNTFGECWGWSTPMHGWSSTPTHDHVGYVLGITPAEPGYSRVRVAPRLGQLRVVAGAVPTPHGYVEVRVTESRRKSIVRSRSPSYPRTAPKLSSLPVNIAPLSANETGQLHHNWLTGYLAMR